MYFIVYDTSHVQVCYGKVDSISLYRSQKRCFFVHLSRVSRSIYYGYPSSFVVLRCVQRLPPSFTRESPIDAATMKIFNPRSDKSAGRRSSGQSSGGTTNPLPSPSNTVSIPSSLHASLPYGFEWSPRPLTHGQTFMMSLNSDAITRDYKRTVSLALLNK
jgi:hypothetical protein